MGSNCRSAIATLVERQTRYCLLVGLPYGYRAELVATSLIKNIQTLPAHLRRSLTWHQGMEMAQHFKIKLVTDLDIYFCDPHSPWQRGSNENTNGLLRQYFPKGTDLKQHSQEHLAQRQAPQDPRLGHSRRSDDPATVRPRTTRRCDDRLRAPSAYDTNFDHRPALELCVGDGTPCGRSTVLYGLVSRPNISLVSCCVGVSEVLELRDDRRRAWRRDGPRPIRTQLWRPGRAGGNPAPLVVLSHGSGGAAVNLTWLAEGLSGAGFLVAAVDHHGNSSTEELLPEGAAFWWERPADLTVVVDHLQRTEDVPAVAAVGYSMGGYTVAAVLGARIDAGKLRRLYGGEPILPIPPDRPNIVADNAALVAKYGREAVEAGATAAYRDPRFLAGVLLAPAICPILDDRSLAAIGRPVLVRWGDADVVEVPADNGVRYARLIPGADGRSMGRAVDHFAFGDSPGGGSVRADVLAEVLSFLHTHLPG